jgi:ABC-type histidine transport system ATPase subunit
MGSKKLREYIKKQLKLEMSKDKDLTKEGIIDNIVNHVTKVLKKANDKRFDVAMQQLAKSGPEGKKAAEHYYDSVELIDKAAANMTNYNKYD